MSHTEQIEMNPGTFGISVFITEASMPTSTEEATSMTRFPTGRK